MPIEIERKYLVRSDAWRGSVMHREWHRQGYLSKGAEGTVRVRMSATHATLTIKSPRAGYVRHEFEYAIPIDHADEMLRTLCVAPLIEKVRHRVPYGGMIWEVDEYCGPAAGLVLAEIELTRPDEVFAIPDWVGAEVTNDKRYGNLSIARASAGKGVKLATLRGKRHEQSDPVAVEALLARALGERKPRKAAKKGAAAGPVIGDNVITPIFAPGGVSRR